MRSDKHLCKCGKCGITFETSGHKRKNCLDCRPVNLEHTKEQCGAKASICNTRWEFQQKYYRYYRKSLNSGWLDEICSHMLESKPIYTFADCERAAKTCQTRSEFARKYKSHYHKALKHKWVDDICSHMQVEQSGFSKSQFICRCNKGRGYGTLYLLECHNEIEFFYKIGITSNTINKRYSNGQDLPYSWKILWEYKGDPSAIWDMEAKFKRRIKGLLYTPMKWKHTKSTECFKCNKEDAILKREAENEL